MPVLLTYFSQQHFISAAIKLCFSNHVATPCEKKISTHCVQHLADCVLQSNTFFLWRNVGQLSATMFTFCKTFTCCSLASLV